MNENTREVTKQDVVNVRDLAWELKNYDCHVIISREAIETEYVYKESLDVNKFEICGYHFAIFPALEYEAHGLDVTLTIDAKEFYNKFYNDEFMLDAKRVILPYFVNLAEAALESTIKVADEYKTTTDSSVTNYLVTKEYRNDNTVDVEAVCENVRVLLTDIFTQLSECSVAKETAPDMSKKNVHAAFNFIAKYESLFCLKSNRSGFYWTYRLSKSCVKG